MTLAWLDGRNQQGISIGLETSRQRRGRRGRAQVGAERTHRRPAEREAVGPAIGTHVSRYGVRVEDDEIGEREGDMAIVAMDRDVGVLVELRKHQRNDVEAQQDETKAGSAFRLRYRPDIAVRPACARAHESIARRQLDRRPENHVGRDIGAARSVRPYHHGAVFVAHDGPLHRVRDLGRAAVWMGEADALERLQRHAPRLQQPHGERLQRTGNAIGFPLALPRRTDEGQRVDGDALGNEIIRHGAIELAKSPGARIEERGNEPVEMSQAPAAELALRPARSRRAVPTTWRWW